MNGIQSVEYSLFNKGILPIIDIELNPNNMTFREFRTRIDDTIYSVNEMSYNEDISFISFEDTLNPSKLLLEAFDIEEDELYKKNPLYRVKLADNFYLVNKCYRYNNFYLDYSTYITKENGLDMSSQSGSGNAQVNIIEGTISSFARTFINGEEYIGFVVKGAYLNSEALRGIFYSTSTLKELPGYEDVIVEYDPEYGPETPNKQGSYNGDDSSDRIPVPLDPSWGVLDAGFINAYMPSKRVLAQFGDIIFPKIDSSEPIDAPEEGEVADFIHSVSKNMPPLIRNLSKLGESFSNGKLIDYVIDCHLIPVKPVESPAEPIKVGYKSTDISAPKVASDYVTFDCGSINISEYYGNFIDYLTRAKLWLPFIGFVDCLKPEHFQNGTIKIVYKFNIIDGSFMAYVLSTSSKSKLSNSVIASYGGNACVHFPLTGINYSNMISGMVGSAMSLIGGAASGNPSAIASSVLQILSAKPDVQSSNGYNSTNSYLSIRYPYLIIERPISAYSNSYKKEKGMPTNRSYKLSDVSGFTICSNIVLDSINATEEEKSMLQDAFKEGVIL